MEQFSCVFSVNSLWEIIELDCLDFDTVVAGIELYTVLFYAAIVLAVVQWSKFNHKFILINYIVSAHLKKNLHPRLGTNPVSWVRVKT